VASVTLHNVRKSYGQLEIVKGLSFEVPDGHFCVLVGPSGCGKSTLLRMVAGLETITAGEIRIDGRAVNDIEPADRDIAMVFQNYALYPHMRVYDNMAYGLRNRGMSKTEIDERVRTTAKTLEIDALLTRRPRELSGGQRQRVAMGRAIVRKPKAFLFDEPLSNLDAKLRVSMRVEIRKLQRNLGTTSIYVTHDQLEAMTLADMLVVMNAGQIEQIGAPLAVYEKPATTFVASFIGAPPMNLLPLTRQDAGKLAGDGALGVPAEGAILGVRPEDLILADGARSNVGVGLDLMVGAVERVGPETFVYGAYRQEGDVIVRVPGKTAPAFGQKITAIAPLDKLHLFSADGRRRIGD
jgi:sn-glycerol 3-phosphate transport system ATP-binding protein